MPSLRRGFFIFCAALVVATPVMCAAEGWWNDDWQFRKELKLDLSAAGANIAGSPANVPVLVRLSLANFGYFNDTKPDGSDFRFMAGDDQTALKFHVERYDPQAQLAFLWVQVPRLTGGAATDKIFLYYGNEHAAAASDVPGTFDKNQVLVYHFGAPSGAPQDATAYKTEPTTFQAEVNPASLIAAGANFSGSTVITVPAQGVLRHVPKDGLTLSTWMRVQAPQSRAYLLALEDANGAIALGLDGAKPFAEARAGGEASLAAANADVTASEWHHVALTVGAGKLTLRVDGVEAASAATSIGEVGGALTMGGSAAGTNFFTGELDEVEVANVARSAEWLEARARTEGVVAPLVFYGPDQSADADAGHEGYFAATLRNVTADGWVVIGILGLMFFWSIWIMINKSVQLGRVAQGNRHFLEEFHKLRDDPAAVERRFTKQGAPQDSAFEGGAEDHEEFGASTLYRLYHHGMREVLTRLEGKSAGAARAHVLSHTAIDSIRVTMDASMTRMTQRLQSQMVLLTIAIAGGPFLGLLGTVIGVMITFAVIAATGDVNVNAIAPGTAAALVATVAGLGVAIPCLFGYNWLNTRVKEIVADMRVFCDEFVARVAEQYS